MTETHRPPYKLDDVSVCCLRFNEVFLEASLTLHFWNPKVIEMAVINIRGRIIMWWTCKTEEMKSSIYRKASTNITKIVFCLISCRGEVILTKLESVERFTRWRASPKTQTPTLTKKGQQSRWEDHEITGVNTTLGSFINLLFLICSYCRTSILSYSYCSRLILTYKWL